MPKTIQGQWYGPRLREAMEAADLNEIDVASRVSLKSAQTVINWCKSPDEDGATEPRASQLGPLAAALGKSVNWLLGYEEAVA